MKKDQYKQFTTTKQTALKSNFTVYTLLQGRFKYINI